MWKWPNPNNVVANEIEVNGNSYAVTREFLEYGDEDLITFSEAGRIILKSEFSDRSVDVVHGLTSILNRDAAKFDPPIEFKPDEVYAVVYNEGETAGTVGVEAIVPYGTDVPDTYTRVSEAEPVMV